jgi:hypothetical protein
MLSYELGAPRRTTTLTKDHLIGAVSAPLQPQFGVQLINMALNISACSAVCLYAAATLAGTTQFVKAMTVQVAQLVSDPLLLMPA